MLEKLISSFVAYLRQNHISVPTSAIEEILKSLPYYNVTNKEEFQMVLRQLLIKDRELFERFDACFDEFFYMQVYDKIYEMEKERKENEVRMELKEIEERLRQKEMKSKTENKQQREKNWLLSRLGSWDGKIEELYSKEVKKRISEDFQHNITKMKELKPGDINTFAENLMWEAILSDQPSIVFDAINQARNNLLNTRNDVNKVKRRQEEVLSNVEKTEYRGMRKMIQTEIDQLKERPISSLNKEQISHLKESLERSSVSLLTKFSKLMKISKSEDEIDMQRSISNSLRTFGVPMELVYRKAKKKKTKIDIIQDVSGSVIKSAEFLSLFGFLIHKQFPGQVRTFAFVGKLDETTHFFKTEDIEKAVEDSLMIANIDYRGYSNYDKALKMYEENYMDKIDDETIVFILGDARNNRHDARIKTFRNLSDKAKYVFWLNPEEKQKWNQGDSVIGKYEVYSDFVEQTTTVNQLVNVLEKIANRVVSLGKRN